MAKRKRASLGCLFWIALILLVVVVFLLNQQNIQAVLKDTGFLTLFQNKDDNKEHGVHISYNTEPEDTHEGVKPDAHGNDDVVNIKIDPKDSSGTPGAAEAQESPSPTPAPTPAREKDQPNIRKARIYFVVMNENDEFELKSVTRSVEYKDSPLTATVQALLNGPTTKEFNNEVMNLIPKQTKINNIYVKGDIAYLDFNEEFRFNSLGVFGLTAQLKQVVFTATEFGNVDQVQILINGKTVNYLAQEGVFVGKPLSRKSFK
jgi:germination protein M